MNHSSRCILAGVLGLLGGWFAGSSLLREADAPAVARVSTSEAQRTPARPRPAVPVGKKHDYQALLREARDGSSSSVIGPELERMSAEKLMSLLSELVLQEGSFEMDHTKNLIARELVRRKGMGAVEDAEAEPDPARRREMKWTLVKNAAKFSPAAAKAWVEREQAKEGTKSNALDFFVIRGASLQGAAELVDLYKKHGDSWKGVPFPNSSFPESFDFPLLVKNLPEETNPGMKNALTYWGAKDKEAAMAAMRENISQHGAKAAGNFGAMITGVAIADGNEKAVAWMVEQLDSLPEDARKTAMKSLTDEVSEVEGVNMNADTIKAIAPKLPREEDRVEFISGHLNPFNGYTKSNIALLRSLPSAGEQEKVLIHAMPELRDLGNEGCEAAIERYATELNFTDEARARVEAAMKAELGK